MSKIRLTDDLVRLEDSSTHNRVVTECEQCNGKGWTIKTTGKTVVLSDPGIDRYKTKCPDCDGTGKVK